MSSISNTTYHYAQYALNLHGKALAALQEQTATGSIINRMSDSPLEAYRLLGLDTQTTTITSQINTAKEMMSTLDISSSVLGDMASTFSDITVDLTQVTSDTYTDSSRTELANQIDDALEKLLSLANKTYQDNYLFGGGNTSNPPYLATYSDGRMSEVTYVGSKNDRQVEIVTGVETSAFYVGSSLLGSSGRGDQEFVSDTGAEAGTGTSNLTGDTWLTITGTAGNYQLSIDGGTTTVTTDGTDTNLAVTDADGNVLFVDTTGITSTGKVMVRSEGTYDIFNSLISLRDILLNTEGLPDTQLDEVRSSASKSLTEISDLLTGAQIKVGARIGFLNDIGASLENIKYNIDEEEAILGDADAAQLAVDLARYKLLYEMSLSVSANMLSISLLDYL